MKLYHGFEIGFILCNNEYFILSLEIVVSFLQSISKWILLWRSFILLRTPIVSNRIIFRGFCLATNLLTFKGRQFSRYFSCEDSGWNNLQADYGRTLAM